MDNPYPSLTKFDCIFLLGHLDASIDVFENPARPLSAPELKMKSMLQTLRGELKQHEVRLARVDGSRPPRDIA
ncbi:MAG TPA: hypothetical protein VHD32_13040 [Candidatus Didemnitutus sp.]|nr:hypothetical protein [Candidatus Didemnitutus sp.]